LDASYAARLADAAGQAAAKALPQLQAAADAAAPQGLAGAGSPGFDRSTLRLSPNDVGALTQTLQTVQTVQTFLEKLPAMAANASAAGAAKGAADTAGVYQTAPGPAGQFTVGSPTAAVTFSAGSAPVPQQAADAAATLVRAFTPTLARATSFLQGVLPSPPPPPAAPAGTGGAAAGAAVATRLNALLQGDLNKAAGWDAAPGQGGTAAGAGSPTAAAAAPAAAAPGAPWGGGRMTSTTAALPPLPLGGVGAAATATATTPQVASTKMSTDAFGRRRLAAAASIGSPGDLAAREGPGQPRAAVEAAPVPVAAPAVVPVTAAAAAAPSPSPANVLELPPLPPLRRPPALPPASSLPNPAAAPRLTPRPLPRPPAGPPGAASSFAAALNSLSAVGAAGVAAFAPSVAPALGGAPIRGAISFAAPPAVAGDPATPSLPAINIPSAAGLVSLPALPLPRPDQLSLAALNPKGDLIWTNPGGAGKGGAEGMTSGSNPGVPGGPTRR